MVLGGCLGKGERLGLGVGVWVEGLGFVWFRVLGVWDPKP